MMMYNADGSRGQMCGNGIRCVGKYVYDHGLTDKTTITVETLAGIKTLVMTPDAHGQIAKVRVDMGEPVLSPAQIPVDINAFSGIDQTNLILSGTIQMKGRKVAGTAVSMGNPHFVIFTDTPVKELDLASVGPDFENHQAFPERVNTEFVNVSDSSHMKMRVWERGSGETFACGTGACAVCVAAALNHKTDRTVDIELLGGHLQITWAKNNHVYMTGPATTVFEGNIDLPDWQEYRKEQVNVSNQS
jgi:diaminopimelate epimerase